MPSQIGTNARQAAGVQKVRDLCNQATEALNALKALKLAKDAGFFGLDPSNNPADPSSFLDATAVKLGFNDAVLCRDNFDAALAAAETMCASGDFTALVNLAGYYSQDE